VTRRNQGDQIQRANRLLSMLVCLDPGNRSVETGKIRAVTPIVLALAERPDIMVNNAGVETRTSVHEDWPMPGNTAYCLAKGGMRILTRTAGVELAPLGITVTGVGPGAVDTPINKETEADPAKVKTLDAAMPLGRLADPAEIASVVAFLAGDGASYITATTVFVDGGIMQSSPGPVTR
jgi:enoyl-[acyl-carrier-protein] reductase (NADH)